MLLPLPPPRYVLPDEPKLLGERYVLPEERVLVERVELPLVRVAVLLLVERVLVVLDVERVVPAVVRVAPDVRAGEVVLMERVLLPVERVAVAVVAVERVLFTSVLLEVVAPERLLASERVVVPAERADPPARLTASERDAAVLVLP